MTRVGVAADVTAMSQGNSYVGIEIGTTVEPAADAWWAPVETVSNSEGGFERVYQGSGLLLSWPLTLEAGARWSATIASAVTVTRDEAPTA